VDGHIRRLNGYRRFHPLCLENGLSTLSVSSYVASDTFVCAYNACDRVPINHIAESVGVSQRPNEPGRPGTAI